MLELFSFDLVVHLRIIMVLVVNFFSMEIDEDECEHGLQFSKAKEIIEMLFWKIEEWKNCWVKV